MQINAQTASVAGKVAKWSPLAGKNNEFVVFMPEGYVSTGRADYYLGGRNNGVHIDRQVVVAKLVNTAILITEFYEGNAKLASTQLQEREKLELTGEESKEGFTARRFSPLTANNRMAVVQHFIIGGNLYVLKAYSPSDSDPVARAFFESVRIATKAGKLAPNAQPGATSTSLPQVREKEIERSGDDAAIPEKEADRKLIILSARGPRFSFDERRGAGALKFKLRALFSSSGKVTQVEVLESSSKVLNQKAIDAVKDTVFIPAEKDGKLVSVYRVLEYSFEVVSY
ncbi:MAG TPA: energy transducer TonB [Pyrinomonadaceae bacterium]|nr:energy transducer TonB [Pyrinomonadaceae bacterium]